jgi:hypothetical protein
MDGEAEFRDIERVARRCACCGHTQLLRSPAVLMPFIAHRVFEWTPVEITDAWGLNTIAKGQAYPLCNSVYCERCDFLFLDIRFSDDEMARLYADYRGESYTALRERYEPGYRARNTGLNYGVGYLADVEAYIQPWIPENPTVLDWGGDTGRNSPFQGRCRRLDIFDISDKPVIDGAQRVDRTFAQQQAYDLIECSQVLEHVPFPCDLLQEMRACMSEQTILYVELPRESLMREAHGSRVVSLKRHWHEHINFFSVTALRAAFNRSGLEVIDMQTAQVTVAGISGEHFRVLARRRNGTDGPASPALF